MWKKITPLFAFVTLWATPVWAVWPAVSDDHKNYYEEFDGGRTITASASEEYYLTGAVAPNSTTGTASAEHALYQGFYFTVCRDLLPPNPVTAMTAVVNGEGDVDTDWVPSSDVESSVWGYRVYRVCYYGPQEIRVRLVDAPDNSGTAFTDAHGDALLAHIRYQYEVRPVDCALNEQTTGNYLVGIEAPNRPHSITDLGAESLPGGDIRLAWSAIPGAEYYVVYRSTGFSVKGIAITSPGQVTLSGYVDDKANLVGGQRYYYVVQAVVAGSEEQLGNGQASAVSDQGGPNAPVILSSTHPVQYQPYANANPAFYWIRSADVGLSVDVKGYYSKIDQDATTGTAVSGPGWAFSTSVEKNFSGVANGVWYFHCRALDQAANLGDEAVYAIQVLSTRGLTGLVTDQQGHPLAGVMAEAWLNGVRQGSAGTDAAGRYALVALPLGTYTVKFNRFGFKPVEKTGVVLAMAETPLQVDQTFVSEAILPEGRAAAYPNPASGSEVRLIYHCAEPCEVTIEIFNVSGERVSEIRENKSAGYQYSVWPLAEVARGVYLFRVCQSRSGGGQSVLATQKFSVVK